MLLRDKIIRILKEAKEASLVVTNISSKRKDKALSNMAKALLENTRYLLSENDKDVVIARKKGLSKAFIDRLTLTEKRIREMANSLKQVVGLKDPVGRIIKKWQRPNRLIIKKIAVPIGVIGIIYESRPNVTSDCAGLCLKSGNSCVLRGGSEAIN